MMDVQSLEAAIHLLQCSVEAELYATPLGRRLRDHAIAHLERRFEATLRDRPRIDSEQAAMNLLREVARELQCAGTSLADAAKALKDAGKGYRASQAHAASQRALKAAEEILS